MYSLSGFVIEVIYNAQELDGINGTKSSNISPSQFLKDGIDVEQRDTKASVRTS